MFSDDIISRVRDSVDIVELVSGYVSLKKTGRNHTGLCPFHSEKTASFSVNPDKQIFHCFGCGAGGDAFKFLELQEGLNFPEAVRKLAERSGISLPVDSRSRFEDKSASDERASLLKVVADAAAYFRRELDGPAGLPARNYLRQRGVSDQVLGEFGIGYARPEWDGLLKHLKQKGYAPGQMEKAGLVVKRSEGEGYYDRFRGRIIFPIRDISGKVIAFGGRVMGDEMPKYLNSSETPLYSKSNTLYCLDSAKEHGRKLRYFIIVEGYLDAIACHQYGLRNAVATLGTALTEGHLRLLRRFADKLVLIFDPDPAGVRASLRSFDLFAGSGMKVNVVSLPENDDPDTFLQKHGQDAFAARLRNSAKFMDFVLDQVLGNGPRSSIDEKVEKAGEMVRFIARIPSSIERDHYLKKTAEVLDIDEGLLRQEMPRQGKDHAEAGHAGAMAVRAHRPKAEEILIHLMLRHDGIAQRLKDRIHPEDFSDPLLRRAAKRVFDVLAGGGRTDAREMLTEGDEELNNLISHYSVLDTEYDDPEKHCDDCLELMRQQGYAKKMKNVVSAIRQAEATGDQAELSRLLAEQGELSRKRGRRITGSEQ